MIDSETEVRPGAPFRAAAEWPLFSVIIPAYNRLPLLKAALGSVFAQTLIDYEVLVVDDGSTDRTADYLASVPAVKLIRSDNRGPGAARNRGVREARGKYVAFLDSDDLWFPWTLSVFAEAIARFNSPTIISGKFIQVFHDAEPETGAVRRAASDMTYFADFLAASRQPYSMGSGTCVFSRQAALATPFPEDRFNAEDHDVILRMGTRPGFVWIDSPPLLTYRRHPHSATMDLASSAKGVSRLLDHERNGAYPGGAARAHERRRILARHARPIAVACLRERSPRQAWNLYRSTLVWNARLGHWRFLAAFPLLYVASFLRIQDRSFQCQRERA
jgi:glycosyltransferase involved in cell wall biosynthesis